MFEFKSKIPDFERGKAKILTTPKIARDRQTYIEYFEDYNLSCRSVAKIPLIGDAEIGQKGAF